MGKAFAGFVQFLLILALTGAVAYNFYEISQLKAEMALLRSGKGANSYTIKRKDDRKESVANSDSAGKKSDMAAVQHHAERAQEFLRKQDYESAKRELEAAAKTVREAGSQASVSASQTVEQLRKTVTDFSSRAAELTGNARQMMNSHPKSGTTKGESNGGKSE